MPKLRWPVVVLLWVARIAGGAWVAIGGLGLLYSGRLDPFAGAFVLGLGVATFAPKRWFIDRETRILLLILLLLGFLSPIQETIKKWPELLMIEDQVLQGVSLALFLCVLAIAGTSLGRSSKPGTGEALPPKAV